MTHMKKRRTGAPKIETGHISYPDGGSDAPKALSGKRKSSLLSTFLMHFRPRTVPERTLKFTLTWGLGGMAAVAVLMQFLTGVLLKFGYEPFPDRAYQSIVMLQKEVLFGQFIRNMHHWTGNILAAVAFLHMLRVFFTGAWNKPRRMNWVIGYGLFSLILISNFTGYLLPWDQLAYWAITICTGMLAYVPGLGMGMQEFIRGGPEVGAASLRIFFTLHTAVAPGCLFFLMGFHFWRVRKAGGLIVPRAPDETVAEKPFRVPAVPNLLLREGVVALMLLAVIFSMSAFFDAPLAAPANPGMSPNPTKAPWYFAGFQEMLLQFHPLFAVFIMPLIGIGILVLLPYWTDVSDVAGIWFRSHRGRRMAFISSATGLIAAPLGIVCRAVFIGQTGFFSGLPPVVGNGVLLFTVCCAGLGGYGFLIRKKFSASKAETVQAIFVLLLVVFAVFTATGIWFRGYEMKLMWPWMTVSGG
jgi:quinol-cytochrome oxidoreductase complex cytochrome b subunit